MSQGWQVKEVLVVLKLPEQFTFSEFVESVQAYLLKGVIFWPCQLAPGITGACLHGEKSVYVFYAEDTTLAYSNLIKIHELIHQVMGYTGVRLDRDEEKYIKDLIIRTSSAYDTKLDTLVMRSLSSSRLAAETEVEELAMAIVYRLLPDRSGPTQSLALIDLD